MPSRTTNAVNSVRDLPVQMLRGVGPWQAKNLARLEILTLGNLLTHYPVRWVDRSEVTSMGDLTPIHAHQTEPGTDGKVRKSVVDLVRALGSKVSTS